MAFSQIQGKGGEEWGDSEKCWQILCVVTGTDHDHLDKEVARQVVGGSEFC